MVHTIVAFHHCLRPLQQAEVPPPKPANAYGICYVCGHARLGEVLPICWPRSSAAGMNGVSRYCDTPRARWDTCASLGAKLVCTLRRSLDAHHRHSPPHLPRQLSAVCAPRGAPVRACLRVGVARQVAGIPTRAVGECKAGVWASVGVPWVEPVAHLGHSRHACTALLFVDGCFDSCERRWPHGL